VFYSILLGRVALGPARRELGIPPIYASAGAARARALTKYASLRTPVADMIQKHKTQWAAVTRGWLTKKKIAHGSSPRVIVAAVWEAVDARVGAVAGARYQTAELEETAKRLRRRGVAHPELAVGFLWLSRWRTGAVWTPTSAAHAGLVPRPLAGTCVSCKGPVCDNSGRQGDVWDYLGHLVTDCTRHRERSRDLRLREQVVELLPSSSVLSARDVAIILLGGSAGGASIWAGPGGGTQVGNGSKADSIWVCFAEFLNAVMCEQMSSLWAHCTQSNTPTQGHRSEGILPEMSQAISNC
jgi:hypothetical protein